jgi:hypothetical protein
LVAQNECGSLFYVKMQPDRLTPSTAVGVVGDRFRLLSPYGNFCQHPYDWRSPSFTLSILSYLCQNTDFLLLEDEISGLLGVIFRFVILLVLYSLFTRVSVSRAWFKFSD